MLADLIGFDLPGLLDPDGKQLLRLQLVISIEALREGMEREPRLGDKFVILPISDVSESVVIPDGAE